MQVTSAPKKLQWYHWALFIPSTVLLVILIVFVALGRFEQPFHMGLITFGYIVFWYKTMFSFFEKQTVLEYDDQNVFFHTSLFGGATVPYRLITRALRQSPNSLEIYFGDLSQLAPPKARKPVAYPESYPVRGNEDDLNRFVEALKANKIVVSEDSIPDDDPLKQNAIIWVTLICLVISMAIVFYIVGEVSTNH